MERAKYGPWAIVTGASAGIGAEFARQLAQHGFHLVLVARRGHLLEELAHQLHQTYHIETRCLSIDLATTQGASELIASTEDLEIGLLVNNAGRLITGAFIGQDIEEYMKEHTLNVLTPTRLAHHFGRKMAARRKGGILFLSSLTAFMICPMISNYVGTRAGITAFGQGLSAELAPYNVNVSVLVVNRVDTDLTRVQLKLDVPMMSPQRVVKEGLIGLAKKRIVIPGLKNRLLVFLATKIIPRNTLINLAFKSTKNWIPAELHDPKLPPLDKHDA